MWHRNGEPYKQKVKRVMDKFVKLGSLKNDNGSYLITKKGRDFAAKNEKKSVTDLLRPRKLHFA